MPHPTPQQLAARAGELLRILLSSGIDPLHDSADLLLVSILPLAIKQALIGNPWQDVDLLNDLLAQMDLTSVETLINNPPASDSPAGSLPQATKAKAKKHEGSN